jgi:TRAP-type C4-dicarboxylate transport system permease small subunit
MSTSYAWVPDMSILLFNWVIFLGGAVSFYNHDHLRLDLLLNKFNEKKEFILNLILFILKVSLFMVMIVYGYQVAIVRMGIYLTGINIPSGLTYLAIPVGGLLMLFFQVVHIIEDFTKIKSNNKN